MNECSENCEHEGNQECHLGGRCEWPIKHRVLPRAQEWAENDSSLYLAELHSAAGGAEEPVENLLETVELALLDIPTGLKPISEDRRTDTLPRHLHLATRAAAEHVAQDLTKNVSPWCCGWPGPAGPACPGMLIS